MSCRTALPVLAGAAILLAAPAILSADSPAKNVIVMIADGAAWNTWNMTSYYEFGASASSPTTSPAGPSTR